jgi:hypothetical protein
MMAQNDLVVVGIDVAKDKVDACIRALSLRQTCPNTAQGHRKLAAWLRKHQVNKAVMEASGGYERGWAQVLRQAGIEVRIVDPKRVRNFALSAGRLAKNDAIDAEMIAWFAETFSAAPGQPHDAAREELMALVKARKHLLDLQTRLKIQNEHAAPQAVQKAHARILKSLAAENCQARGRKLVATIKSYAAFSAHGVPRWTTVLALPASGSTVNRDVELEFGCIDSSRRYVSLCHLRRPCLVKRTKLFRQPSGPMKVLARSRYGAAKSGSGRVRSDRQRPAADCSRAGHSFSEHADDNRFRYYKGGLRQWRNPPPCRQRMADFAFGSICPTG